LFWAIFTLGCLIIAWLSLGLDKKHQYNLPIVIDDSPKTPETALLFFMPLDINRVSLEGFDALPQIGLKRAEKMVQYRHQIGFFIHKDELLNLDVPWSPLLISRLWPYLTVNKEKFKK